MHCSTRLPERKRNDMKGRPGEPSGTRLFSHPLARRIRGVSLLFAGRQYFNCGALIFVSPSGMAISIEQKVISRAVRAHQHFSRGCFQLWGC